MPSPSRWGPAAGYVNVSAPSWVYEAIDHLRRENDWKTMGGAGLELIVEALKARGIAIPPQPETTRLKNPMRNAEGDPELLRVAEAPAPTKRKGQVASGARGGRRE